MKLGQLVVLLQVAVWSCLSTSNQAKISEAYVQELAKGDFKIPSPHSFDILFVRSDNEKVVKTSVNTLYSIYQSHFTKDFSRYAEFLSATLNGSLEIPWRFFHRLQAEAFVPEIRVSEIYERSTRNEFVAKYCIEEKPGNLTIKDSVLDSREIDTVLYYLFINSYKIQPVDSEKSFIISSVQ